MMTMYEFIISADYKKMNHPFWRAISQKLFGSTQLRTNDTRETNAGDKTKT